MKPLFRPFAPRTLGPFAPSGWRARANVRVGFAGAPWPGFPGEERPGDNKRAFAEPPQAASARLAQPMDHEERQPDGPQAGARAGPDERAGPVELAMQRFIAAQRIHTLYPANNPNVRAAVAKLREAIAAFPPGSPWRIDVKGEHLECDEAPVLSDHKEVRDLAQKLYFGHVASVLFEPDVTDAEIITLFDVLRLGEEERIELGPLEDALPRRGVARIQVRDAGRVTLKELSAGSADPWDATSLGDLEELEKEVLGGSRRGFREALRAVAEGEDAKAARLTGLLDRPAEFATLLLEVASRHRPNNQIDLDAQLAFTLKLVSEIEHMIEKLAVQDRARLYRKLQDVVDTLVRSIRREILDVALPPYVRLGAIARLFPGTIRMLTVKEALGLGLGAGLMPFLMGALRRVAAGDRDLPAFLSGAEPPEPASESELAEYRPAALASALPSPPRLQPVFFEPAPGGAPHPGEMALSRATLDANGTYDSVATILDLLGIETEVEGYEKLLERSP